MLKRNFIPFILPHIGARNSAYFCLELCSKSFGTCTTLIFSELGLARLTLVFYTS